MDLRKIADMYFDIPIFLMLIYYFYNKNKKTSYEKILFILVCIGLFINILLSSNLIKTRYVSWKLFI